MFSTSDAEMRPATVVVGLGSRGARPLADMATRYDVRGIVGFLTVEAKSGAARCRFTRVALQFPDDLLQDAVRVLQLLTAACTDVFAETAPKFFVLADTTFASCCPDEITAQHYQADAIVHFGYACMSRTVRLPVFHVVEQTSTEVDPEGIQRFVRETISVLASRRASTPSTSLVRLDVVLSPSVAHRDEDIVRALSAGMRELGDASLQVLVASHRRTTWVSAPEASLAPSQGDSSAAAWSWTLNGISLPQVDGGSGILHRYIFVGDPTIDAALLLQLGLLYEYRNTTRAASDDATTGEGECGVVICSPSGCLLVDNGQRQRLVQQRLRQRMFHVEALKRAESIGIVTTSLAIEGYKRMAEVLRQLIRASSTLNGTQRRAYIIYVGHLNQFKLANFVDSVDCFVAISCPTSRECTFPSKDDQYIKPVVTPAEVLLALDVMDYASPAAFTTHFPSLLSVAEASLVSLRKTDRYATEGQGTHDNSSRTVPDQSAPDLQVATTGQDRALTSQQPSTQSLLRLNERAYVGLEPKVGETSVQREIHEGRTGIARGYANERHTQPND